MLSKRLTSKSAHILNFWTKFMHHYFFSIAQRIIIKMLGFSGRDLFETFSCYRKLCNSCEMNIRGKSSWIHSANIEFVLNDIVFDSRSHATFGFNWRVHCALMKGSFHKIFFYTRILNKLGMCFSAWLRFYNFKLCIKFVVNDI